MKTRSTASADISRPLLTRLAAAAFILNAITASAADPTNFEQYMLELINRARSNGAAEATRLGLSSLQEGVSLGGEAWTIENSVQPLAWNSMLNNAAAGQATSLNNADQFFLGGSPHTFGGNTPDGRIMLSGYLSGTYTGPTTTSGFFPGAENVAESVKGPVSGYTPAQLKMEVLNGHNGLFIDDGTAGRGHRNTTMLGAFKEIGLSISVGTDNSNSPGMGTPNWDSVYIVQNFGIPTGGIFLTGVVFNDTDLDSFYSPGEGLGGITVKLFQPGTMTLAGMTTSYGSGGYSLAATPGAYDVQFMNSGGQTYSTTVNWGGTGNFKLDAINPVFVPEPAAGALAAIGGVLLTLRRRRS